jgi:chromosome partitioning protein
MRFLASLDIPLVATLRDSQNFVRAAENGVGVCEMPRWQAWPDLAQLERLMHWLDGRQRGLRPTVSSVAAMADAS